MRKKFVFVVNFIAILCILSCIYIVKYNKEQKNLECLSNSEKYKKQYVYPLGNIVGINAYTKGVLVIGFEDENMEYIGGLKKGDNILQIEGHKVDNVDDISKVLNKLHTNEAEILFKRNNKFQKCKVKIKKENNQFRLGIWIRDKISGIGTLTCYDPINDKFYAIGHGICDVDTKELLSIKKGEIYSLKNIKIYKKNKKDVGEIIGDINRDNFIGNFNKNSKNGIKGELKKYKFSYPLIEIATQKDVKLGKAYVLFQSKQGDIKPYEINIEKIIKEKNSMLVNIVDKELIEYTGGIVRGMSGAPIIQNNKIIGSLTYVFKNNIQKGYGIFIEEMLKL